MTTKHRFITTYSELCTTRKEIRLLHLGPALRETDPIICRFSIVSLTREYDGCLDTHSTQYEALSYVWGIEKHAIPVHVNGVPIGVTVNLYHALQDCDWPIGKGSFGSMQYA
ncbi:uncharacterized protein K460DRAFT_370207 [Cucurbitaria berberidis CBS 394.84]|uniref:Heterokaryon incompatibility domain-containing protein n=1 Tax=Cucurbitaria berberidis CBS 394.84 TaxID=1168544 RepID=A0A9P4GAI9_9PLEO|nr:uncharacterized protein K460DRAFT_370207 [Cucurbitaria berberidis CBS 394.84]KAF1842218.1 hypothetical protein K460DRAFT_370207 [Cucurbitaria berberidis CBS 394.84]